MWAGVDLGIFFSCGISHWLWALPRLPSLRTSFPEKKLFFLLPPSHGTALRLPSSPFGIAHVFTFLWNAPNGVVRKRIVRYSCRLLLPLQTTPRRGSRIASVHLFSRWQWVSSMLVLRSSSYRVLLSEPSVFIVLLTALKLKNRYRLHYGNPLSTSSTLWTSKKWPTNIRMIRPPPPWPANRWRQWIGCRFQLFLQPSSCFTNLPDEKVYIFTLPEISVSLSWELSIKSLCSSLPPFSGVLCRRPRSWFARPPVHFSSSTIHPILRVHFLMRLSNPPSLPPFFLQFRRQLASFRFFRT